MVERSAVDLLRESKSPVNAREAGSVVNHRAGIKGKKTTLLFTPKKLRKKGKGVFMP